MKLAVFISLIAVTVAAKLPAARQPTKRDFSTEDTANLFRGADLTEFGYYGGQLPRIYEINSTGGFQYNADLSHAWYEKIIAGKDNATIEDSTRSREGHNAVLNKRAGGSVDFAMWRVNSDAKESFTNLATNSGCKVDSTEAAWRAVGVTRVSNAGLSFWETRACNGKRQNFQPVCGNSNYQSCAFTGGYLARSLRVVDNCNGGTDCFVEQ